jgi:hypothetical protein
MSYRRLLPAANLIACVLFVVLRAPAPAEYLAEVDDARRAGGIFINSGIVGTLACRMLHSWSSWHGGEALGVKILEVANLPALVVTAGAHVLGEVTVARVMSACGWSWLLAGVFMLVASVQWWLVGLALDHRRRRSQQRSRTT